MDPSAFSLLRPPDQMTMVGEQISVTCLVSAVFLKVLRHGAGRHFFLRCQHMASCLRTALCLQNPPFA